MRHQATTEQISFYQDNGYLIIEDFLTPGELAYWQAMTQEAVDQRLAATRMAVEPQEGVSRCGRIEPGESGQLLCSGVYTVCQAGGYARRNARADYGSAPGTACRRASRG